MARDVEGRSTAHLAFSRAIVSRRPLEHFGGGDRMKSMGKRHRILMGVLVLVLLLHIGGVKSWAESGELFTVVVAINSDVDTLFPINEPNNTLPQHFNFFNQVVERNQAL